MVSKLSLQQFWQGLRYDVYRALGCPASMHRLTAELSASQLVFPSSHKGISVDNIMRWHQWIPNAGPGTGFILWWCQDRGRYKSSFRHIPALENITRCKTIELWKCDIQDVEGLAAAKGGFDGFVSLDGWVAAHSPEMIDDLSEKKLRKNLDHDQIRILNPKSRADSFARYLWHDKRTFLLNHGGAHHFAAARYIASKLHIPVPLTGRMDEYSLNPQCIQKLTSSFAMYAMEDRDSLGLLKGMEAFKASYGVCPLPSPHADANLIVLPRDEWRSMKASDLLKQAGVFNVADYMKQRVQTYLKHHDCGDHAS